MIRAMFYSGMIMVTTVRAQDIGSITLALAASMQPHRCSTQASWLPGLVVTRYQQHTFVCEAYKHFIFCLICVMKKTTKGFLKLMLGEHQKKGNRMEPLPYKLSFLKLSFLMLSLSFLT